MDISTLFSLEGRCALITGGSRGIGKMIAEGFVRAGVRVYITARKAEACDATAAELSELGTCVSIPGDISTTAGRAEVVAKFREHESALDILVNNAGAAWGAPFDEFPESGWDKVMDLNVKALFFLIQDLAPELRAVGRAGDHLAKVINIGSIDGMSINPVDNYSYVAAKAGVIHLTKKLALNLIDDGIVVNGIAPGAFPSSMNREARDQSEAVAQGIPSGRIGTPEDMAGVAIYLASRAGDYVVGTTVAVDGGVTWAR
ncbi:SDR family oxidoreductase [Brevibacterium sp. 50QC2O2]|mgnify:CR=1 FL=1|jgi:NAD(P)-dependent dehydrogenase (short-subunit alcohol dehydrogenase family)|uniref:SDR family oxidoreductase n=1 Tax=Brevibacterium TaxID=1696 RepID=UPI00211BB4D2|nr:MULTISPECIES: SDR family oxidoreductase [unclassified Brevibacterium]MCQ9367270.1 SDR family oxidoreductase [Brevibacterium sp. 91QC2O2]MCQ9386754.1 SDR family oxidoreductase [Brevibacterium sp. 68QC2CO]MCQ9389762.1 SDR family oxidoreductase [Brevibacterium sp. 50QC2O2]